MPRLPRISPAGIPLHLTQRGHNRQACFASSPQDYATYAHYLREAAQRFEVDIHAWVFMTNHVHILATPRRTGAISRLMQSVNRNYVCYFNAMYQRSGTLWEGRFRSCLVETAQYLLQCYRYIELNPVRAGMVDDPGAYPWSSFRCNAWGVRSALLTPHAEYLQLGKNADARQWAYRELFTEVLDAQMLEDIRDATKRNMAIGSHRFKDDIENAHARRVCPARAGRPRTKYDSDTYFSNEIRL